MKLAVVAFALSSLLMSSCSSEPSELLVKRKDREVKDFGGTISTYNPEVDILFIVDDSGSMSSYQNRLAENATLFTQKFFNARFIDYHIGVTSTTEFDSLSGGSKAAGGKLHRIDNNTYVERSTLEGDLILMQMLDLGISGSYQEKVLSIPQKVFSERLKNSFNRGFLRENAHLMIFVLTDTYDQSKVEPEETYKFLLDLKKGDESKIHFAAAIVTIEKAKCTGESKQVQTNLRKMVDLFQRRGHRFNICQSNYGEDLARVAENVVNAVSTVYLQNVPDITTMKVYYGDEEIPNQAEGGWTYDYTLNAIHLSPDIDVIGQSGEQLRIEFEEIYKIDQ